MDTRLTSPEATGTRRRRPPRPATLIAALLVAGWAAWMTLAPAAMGQAPGTTPGVSPAPASPAPAPLAPAGPTVTVGDGDLEMGKGVPTVAKLFMSSPYINGALLVLSVIAGIVFLFLFLSLTVAAFAPGSFVDDVTKLVLNRQFDQAIHLCQQNRDVFSSSVIQRVLENRDKDMAVLMDILDAEGRRRAEIVWNRIAYLSEISNIAPMLGLLGTVIGMIKVFFTMSIKTPGDKVVAMSSGIAEAMSTTVLGLIVAILAGVFYTIARSRATVVLAETEQTCHTVADHTHRSADDPRLKKIDALADAARKKLFTGRPDVKKPGE